MSAVTNEMIDLYRKAAASHNPYSADTIRAGLEAALASLPESGEAVAKKLKVKPLVEGDTGWHDDNGRFCVPLTNGYFIKYPKGEEKPGLFAAWYFNTPIGASSIFKEAEKIAQDHHERRILSSLFASPSPIRGEVDRLRKALEPFARLADTITTETTMGVNVDRLRDARAALEGK